MIVSFQLRFHTQPGEDLWLTGEHEIFGGGDPAKALPLRYLNAELWQLTLSLPGQTVPNADLVYRYILRSADGSEREDWGAGRAINLVGFGARHLLILDSWNEPGFIENAFCTEPFEQVLLRPDEENRDQQPGNPRPVGPGAGAEHQGLVPGASHLFRVKAPLLAQEHTLCLLGNLPSLGAWDPARAILLQREARNGFFSASLDLRPAGFPIQYKYGVFDLGRNVFVLYEQGPNRLLDDQTAPEKLTVVNDGFARLPATGWKGAGVAIPGFSLRTEQSVGVGEFSDLRLLADWCARTGIKMIQVLPVNDTRATHTWTDSYPYAAISAFALHPLYLNLQQVTTAQTGAWLEELEPERRRLNALEEVDYEAVLEIKVQFLKRIYPLQKQQTFGSPEFLQFFEANRDWLVPYAVFCHLRDQHGTSDFNRWPAQVRECRPEKIAALAAPNSEVHDAVAINFFLQFHLHRQLQESVAYAHSRGVVLKGDIPIGVYRYGADAWQSPELFHVEMQAGAPPDAFAVKGQNWGFPTYNWPRMKQRGFRWWQRRFEQMGEYFDAFRIDHILGFFRIWSIPLHAVEGILGRFVPALPVHADEFTRRGIPFEPRRFLRPFINDKVLEQLFGSLAGEVRDRFLVPTDLGGYELRPEYATQRQVEACFANLQPDQRVRGLQEGLYDLISNVLLFEVRDRGATEYHFRFALDKTSSFQALPPETRRKVWDLYLDYFFVRQDAFWRREAMQKLPGLKRRTRMLVCGEDLGLVPGCVPEVMKELGILSLEVQRMPKDTRRAFSSPKDAPYLAVVTPGTHDMSTIRAWWKEDRATTQRFYNLELGLAGQAPQDCEPWVSEAILRQHLASPAMWSIFPIQDLLGMAPNLRRSDPMQERINVPANPRNYWRYRLHLRIESLLAADDFNRKLKSMLEQNGR